MAITPKFVRNPDGSHSFTAEMELREIQSWTPTMARIRDCVFKRHIVGMNTQDEASRLYAPRQSEVEAVSQSVFEAFTAGRVIDFGHVPNEVIKEGGQRGGTLYQQGFIGMPFREPWVLTHTWDAGAAQNLPIGDRQPAVYLVQLVEHDMPAGGQFEALELEPVTLQGEQTALMIGDRIVTYRDEENRLCAKCLPALWRVRGFLNGFIKGDVAEMLKGGASNVTEPIMTGLLILSTDGIDRRTVPAPEKLNRQRAKHQGKPPIPPYDVVDTLPYVTALQAKRTPRRKGEALGGHHASPIMHLRRGHPRTYASGERTWIRDTLVNATDETRAAFMARRTGYTVRP